MGTAMMGGILATMHMPYRGGEMEPLLEHGEAKAVICTAPLPNHDAPATMLALKQHVASLEHVLVAGDEPPAGTLSLTRMIAEGSDTPIADPPSVEDFCSLCFTSGTSAAPKGVMRSYQSFAANARVFSPVIELTADDVVMVAPPFTHVFGLCCANLTLFSGATNLLMPLFTPEGLRRLPGEWAVPAWSSARPRISPRPPRPGSSTGSTSPRSATSSSPARFVRRRWRAAFEKRLPGGRVGQLFGMTEVILVMQTPLDAPPQVRHGSTGRCTEGIEARVAGPDGAVLGVDEEGELQISGYTVMAGYLKNDAANAEAFTADGWYRTGDLATINADGDVVITGRVKDLINRGGIKINPTDLENAVMAHEAVIQAAIVPMVDDVMGEKACLFVTLTPGASLSFDEMTGYLAGQGFAKMKWPERLEVIDEMPMTPTRKIIKGELVARLTGRITVAAPIGAKPLDRGGSARIGLTIR